MIRAMEDRWCVTVESPSGMRSEFTSADREQVEKFAGIMAGRGWTVGPVCPRKVRG